MEDKIEEILAQYPIEVKSRKRVRGAFLLETEEGLRLLRGFSGSRSHLETEEQIKLQLIRQGSLSVDLAVPNRQGELLTRDGSGNLWLMKQWFSGHECDIRDAREVRSAAEHLAKLHKIMVQLPREGVTAESSEAEMEAAELQRDGDALTKNEMVPEIAEVSLYIEKGADFFSRRNRELKRIHGYIRKKRRKNEMELALLNAFHHYYEQGCEAQSIDDEKETYLMLQKQAWEENRYMHGGYNYHNLLFQGKRIATTNFENAKVGIQVLDLYGFLRKVMEKNGWNQSLGIRMLDAYRSQRELSEDEKRLLYTLLLYPEKYWKQCNFYYNGKKSWMSGKNYEKLLHIQAQEEERLHFLDTIKGLLF